MASSSLAVIKLLVEKKERYSLPLVLGCQGLEMTENESETPFRTLVIKGNLK